MTIDSSLMQTFQSNFDGDIILPGNPEYEQASTVFMAKGEPAIIVRPRSDNAVAASVTFAKSNSLVISVRSGGHSGAGYGTNDGGMIIDLAHMNKVEVIDDANHIVRIQGGAHWGITAAELEKHGLAISSGDTTTVGVGGLATAGGIGWMVRRYGLTIDSLVRATVVTASGDILSASETENTDLFWGIRGGGGNFGIVTSFEFEAHPTKDVYAGSIVYDFAQRGEVLKKWRDYMRTAPEELTTMIMPMPSLPMFGGQPAALILLACYASDDHDEAMAIIESLKQLGTVLSEDIKKKPYAEVLDEAHSPQGAKVLVNNTFVDEFSDELIDTIVQNDTQMLQIRSVGGAMNRVAPDATAFAHRSSEALIIAPVFMSPTASESEISAALEPWRAIAKFGHGAYINFFNEWTAAESAAAYPADTFNKLVALKRQYDPENTFHRNYNISPDSELR